MKGGRCESCAGDGLLKIEMHFLPDIYVPLRGVQGQALQPGNLEVKYKGKEHPRRAEHDRGRGSGVLRQPPQTPAEAGNPLLVGLGYLKIGQSSTTLSGGEAQRVKLATELSRRSTGKTIYILDEPTTGLGCWKNKPPGTRFPPPFGA